MSDARILIDCEGSGYPVQSLHRTVGGGYLFGMCAMCGQEVDVEPDAASDGVAAHHQRDDVLARIERGDFDE